MKTKLRILFIAMLFGQAAHAQTVEYKAKDFTHKLSPFKLSVTGAFNIGINVGILAQGQVGKIGYTAIAQRAISPHLFLTKDNVANPDNVKAIRYLEGGIDYFFSDKTKDGGGKVKIDVSSSTYFHAVCDKRKLTGLHGGLIHYNQTVAASNTSDGLYTFKTLSGNAPTSQTVYYFNTNSNYLFAGIVFKKVIKTTVSSDGWKYFRHMGRRIYMDALIGGSSYEKIPVGSSVYSLGSTQTSPVGYRLGFEWDQMGTVTTFEIGQRPQRYALGLPGFNYMMLSFSFNIYHGDKTYAMSKKYTEKKSGN